LLRASNVRVIAPELRNTLQMNRSGHALGLAARDVMPEESNVEIAHKMVEPANPPRRGWEEGLEILEVLLLAIVAVATAWSGYQSAKWDGEQALSYGISTRDRFAADAASTFGGQELVADASLFTAWLQAKHAGNADLQRELERRFTPDYRTSFEAWLRTDPDNNPSAPAGPGYMPHFQNPHLEEAKRLNERAGEAFERGTLAREIADRYVRDTVRLATVLFVVGIAPRFKVRAVRLATDFLALALLLFALVGVLTRSRL
jgi:hypothetical protein